MPSILSRSIHDRLPRCIPNFFKRNKEVNIKKEFGIETLEPRTVFSVNIGAGLLTGALTATQTSNIVSGLESLGKAFHQLDTNGDYTSLPGIEQGLGDLFKLGSLDGKGGFLGDAFRDLFNTQFPGATTVSNVNTFLNTDPGAGTTGSYANVNWSFVNGGTYTGSYPLEWTMTVSGDKAVLVNSQMNEPSFTVKPALSGTSTGSVTFSFGLDSSDNFFATIGNNNVSVTIADSTVAGTLTYTGGHNYTVASGNVALNAALSASITAPANSDGILTSAELATLDLSLAGGFTTAKSGTGLNAKYDFNTSSKVTVIQQGAAFAIPQVTHDILLTNLVANIGTFVDKLQTVSANVLTEKLLAFKLPGIGTSFNDITLSQSIDDTFKLKTASDTYLALPSPTVFGLGNAIAAGFPTALGATATESFNPADGTYSINFAFDTGVVSKTVDFDRFGESASSFGLSFNRDQTLKLALNARISGGLELGFNVADQSIFAVPSVVFNAGFSATDINLLGSVGPLSASINHGSSSLDAKLHVNADADGKITVNQLITGFAFTTVGDGEFHANLPIDTGFNGTNLTGAKLKLDSTDVFHNPTAIDITTPNFDKVFSLGKTSPEQILDFLIDSGTWAEQFKNSSIFNVNIPFTDSKLSDVFDFGALFSKNLKDKLSTSFAYLTPESDFVSFTSAAPIAIKIVSGASVLPVSLTAGTYTLPSLISALNTALSGTNYSAIDDGTGKFRFVSATNSAFSVLGSGEALNKLGIQGTLVKSQAVAQVVPTGFAFASDISFQISVDGGTPQTITVPFASTTTNTTIADLVSDINTVLGTNATAVNNNGKIRFENASGKAFAIMPGTGSASLGLTSAIAGGIQTVNAFVEETRAFSTLNDLVPILSKAIGLPAGTTIGASFDPVTMTFKLDMDLSYAAPTLNLPVGFNFNLDGIGSIKTVDASGNATDVTLSVTPSLDGHVVFGIQLGGSNPFEELTVQPEKGFAPKGYLAGATGPDPDHAKSWDGKLSANATWTFSLDDAVDTVVTVASSSTTTNTTVADLAADVQTAINLTALNGKIGVRVLDETVGTAERLQFYTIEQTNGYQIRTLQVKSSGVSSSSTGLGFGANLVSVATDPAVLVPGNVSTTIDYSPATDVVFKISLDGAAEETITVTTANMSTNTKMADLLTDINTAISGSALTGKVMAERIGGGNQIGIFAKDGFHTMRVDPEGAAVTDLKFNDAAASVRTKGGSFFIEDASLTGTVELNVNDLRLAANLGFVGIKTGDSTGTLTFTAKAELVDGTDTRFEIGELFNRIAEGNINEIVTKTFDGSGTVTLTGFSIQGGLLSLSTNAEIEIVGSNLISTPSFVVTYNGVSAAELTKLTNFSDLNWRQIYTGVKAGIELLAQTSAFDFLNDQKIPLLNLTVHDVFNFTDSLIAKLDAAEADPGGTLQTIEHQIEQLLGIPDQNFSLTLEDGPSVKIHLGISTTYSETLGLNFNFADLASLSGNVIDPELLKLGGFVDASANGSLQFTAYAGAQLDLKIDLTDSNNPEYLVLQSSGVDLGLRVVGQNLNINATLGPAGFAIHDGNVVFDSDGLLDGSDADDLIDEDYAIIHFGPKNDLNAVTTLDYLDNGTTLTSLFGVTFTGVMTATLPGSITSEIGEIDLPGPIIVSIPSTSLNNMFHGISGSVDLTIPDFAELIPRAPGIIELIRDPSIFLNGIDSGLSLIQKALDSKLSQKIPLIGDQLASGSHMIEDFRNGFLADLTKQLKGAGDDLLANIQLGMFNFFDGDLGILQDYNGDGSVTVDDVVLTFRNVDGTIWKESGDPADQDAIQFNLKLGQSFTFGTDLKIDFGVPGLQLKFENAHPELTAGWDLFLGFGISVTDFFYLDSNPTEEFTGSGDTLAETTPAAHELSVHFDASLTQDPTAPFHAFGKLFFLQLDAYDREDDGEFSHVSGEFFVNLNDPGTLTNNDNRVTVNELFKKGVIKPIEAGLTAEAVINLDIIGSVQGSAVIPRLLTDFDLDWNFVAGEPVAAPTIGFANARLDLGSFISDFLKPIAVKIDDIIKPLDPVLDALQLRIPVLSDFLGRDYTVLDLAVQFGQVDRRFIDAVLQVRALVGEIALLPPGVSIEIPIGSLLDIGGALMSKDGAQNIDTSSQSSTGVTVPDGDANQNKYRDTFNKSVTMTGGGFGFPILKPSEAFKLLLGQDATLVTYDLPRLEVGLSMSKTFPIWGPLVGKFSGSVSAYADLAFGFDTKGFNTYKISGDVIDILDGFYVSDRANADGTGADVYEAGFTGRIGIGGAINAAIIEAGIEGFFELHADLDLNDPNNDGKIRGSEIIALIDHPNGYGPLNLGSITLKGEVGARAYVDFWAPFDWYNAWEQEFVRVTIFEKTFAAPLISPDLGTLKTVGTENVLTLNAGPTANQRDFISTSDVGEEFQVTGTGKNISVYFANTKDTVSYTNVDLIIFNGGKGDDRLIIASTVTTAFTFDGGEGDDEFQGGGGDDIVTGGIGNDIINGGAGKNTLDGGDGADIITGGSGNDIIIGGNGDDSLDGFGGSDTFKFSDGWGRDTIENGYFATSGHAKFDLSDTTKDLTLNLSSTGFGAQQGRSTVSWVGDPGDTYVNDVVAGSGNDITVIASSGDGIVTIDGGLGNDQFIGSLGRLKSEVNLIGGAGNDTAALSTLINGFAVGVGQTHVTATKTTFVNQTINFDSTFENLNVDAKAKAGDITLLEKLDFVGDVRLASKTAAVEYTVNAANIKVESTRDITIGADFNAKSNGNITVIVNGGNIVLNGNLNSSTSTAFSGDGAGLIHLFTGGGQILTGTLDAGGHASIFADKGSLLLRGTNGSIGTLTTPIYTQVETLAANTTGGGLINISEENGLVISEIASIVGITTTGGQVKIFNNNNVLKNVSPINANGGNISLTTDMIDISNTIDSDGANILIQPEGVTTLMGIGDNVNGIFDLNQSELSFLSDGFDKITIGRIDGKNLINLGDTIVLDPLLIQTPILGGHINQTGELFANDNATFTILGSGHTTELDNQTVVGNIDIIDSAIVRDGETVTLKSTAGNIFINFNIDGTLGGGSEILNLNSFSETVIKGNVGGNAPIGTLHITAGSNIRIEGYVFVDSLIVDAGATFVVDGTMNAGNITISNLSSTTFHSGLNLTGDISNNSPSQVFEGAVNAANITLTGSTLVDFYQTVTAESATIGAGDFFARQSWNVDDATLTLTKNGTFIGPVNGFNLNVTGKAIALQATTTLSGDLTVNAMSSITSGNISSDAISLTGTSYVGGLISASSFDANMTGAVTIASLSTYENTIIKGTTLQFLGQVSTDGAGLDLTGSSILFSNGSAVNAGNISLKTTSLNSGEVRFTGTVNAVDLKISSSRPFIFQEAAVFTGDVKGISSSFVATTFSYVTLDLNTGSSTFNSLSGGSTRLNGTTINGTSIDGTVVTLTGTGNISLSEHLYGTVVSATTAGAVNIYETTGTNSVTLSGSTLNVGSGGILGGSISLTGSAGGLNSIVVNGPILGTNVDITANKGVLFTTPVDVDSLIINAGTSVSFLGSLNAIDNISITAGTTLNLTSGIHGKDLLLSGSTITLGASSSSTGNSVFNATNFVTIAGFDGSGSFNVTTTASGAGNGFTSSAAVSAATSSGSVTVNTPRKISGTDISSNGDVSLTGLAITFNDINARALTLTSSTTTISGIVSESLTATGNSTFTSVDTGDFTFSTNNLTVTGNVVAEDIQIVLGNNISFANVTAVSIDANLATLNATSLTIDDDITISSSGNIAISTIIGTDVNIDAGRGVGSARFTNSSLTADSAYLTSVLTMNLGTVNVTDFSAYTYDTLHITGVVNGDSAHLGANRIQLDSAITETSLFNAATVGTLFTGFTLNGGDFISSSAISAETVSIASKNTTFNSITSDVVNLTGARKSQSSTLIGTTLTSDEININNFSSVTLGTTSGGFANLDNSSMMFTKTISLTDELNIAGNTFTVNGVTSIGSLDATLVDNITFGNALTVNGDANIITSSTDGLGNSVVFSGSVNVDDSLIVKSRKSVLSSTIVADNFTLVAANATISTLIDVNVEFFAGVTGTLNIPNVSANQIFVVDAAVANFNGSVNTDLLFIGESNYQNQAGALIFGHIGNIEFKEIVNSVGVNINADFTKINKAFNVDGTFTIAGLIESVGSINANNFTVNSTHATFSKPINVDDDFVFSAGELITNTVTANRIDATFTSWTSGDIRSGNIVLTGGDAIFANVVSDDIKFVGNSFKSSDLSSEELDFIANTTIVVKNVSAESIKSNSVSFDSGNLVIDDNLDISASGFVKTLNINAGDTYISSSSLTAVNINVEDLTVSTGVFVTNTVNADSINAAFTSWASSDISSGNIDLTGGNAVFANVISDDIKFNGNSFKSIDLNSDNVDITASTTIVVRNVNAESFESHSASFDSGNLTIDDTLDILTSGFVKTLNINAGNTYISSNALTVANVNVNDLTIVTIGKTSVSGTLNAGVFLINSGTSVFDGNVTVDSVTSTGGSVQARSNYSVDTNAIFNNTANITIDGSFAAGNTEFNNVLDVSVTESFTTANVLFNGHSFIAGSTLNSSDATFTASGDIRVVGIANVNSLTITTADNTTFQGSLNSTNSVVQSDGRGTTRFEGVTVADSFNVRTEQQIYSGATFRAGTGNITLISEEIDFVGGTNSVQGIKTLNLSTYFASSTIDIGSPTPTGQLDISDVDINALKDGFTNITIGRVDGTGSILAGSSVFKDNLVINGGDITFENNPLVGQVFSSLETITLNSVGDIVTNDDIYGTDLRFSSLYNTTINKTLNGQIGHFTAGDANGATSNVGDITFNGDVNLTSYLIVESGKDSGDVVINANINSTTSNIRARGGSITQISGVTTASDIFAKSRNGITLTTKTNHINANVFEEGNIVINDLTALPHFLDLGSKTNSHDGLFTDEGDITVTAVGDINAYRVNASGSVNITGHEVYLDNVSGSPATVTGTILLDENRETFGADIRFDGNIRLLRDISFSSHGGNIIITGTVQGTDGTQSLTLLPEGGFVSIGGAGAVTPIEFLSVVNASAFTTNGGIHSVGDISIESDSIDLNAPRRSISTIEGSLILEPRDDRSIDIGRESEAFSLNDSELASLANGFSSIVIGRDNGLHNVNIESAMFIDDVVINGNNVNVLASSTTQSVNGISVVNGAEHNNLHLNAQNSFTQGNRAAISAGGDISITSDNIALDENNKNTIRGFGTLTLQPFTSRDINLGSGVTNGNSDLFALNTKELNAISSTFNNVVIGNENSGDVLIDRSISFNSSTSIYGNNVLVENLAVLPGKIPITGRSILNLGTQGRNDSFAINARGNISIDASLKTTGSGSIDINADFDHDDVGDLSYGLHSDSRTKTSQKTQTISVEHGNVNFNGVNVNIGSSTTTGVKVVKNIATDVVINSKLPTTFFKSLTGNFNSDSANIVNSKFVSDSGRFDLNGNVSLNATSFTTKGRFSTDGDSFNSVKTSISAGNVILDAVREINMSSTIVKSMASVQIQTGHMGVITLEQKDSISAIKDILISGSIINRNNAKLTAKNINITTI